MPLSNSVFISYRRAVSGLLTLAIWQDLDKHGIDIFYDITSIPAGKFAETILNQIAARAYFMPVLTPGTLDRCPEPGDWLLRELQQAIKCQRMIVPLYTPDFNAADIDNYLPSDAAGELSSYQRVELPINKPEWFGYAMQDVRERLLRPIDRPLATVSPTEAVEVAQRKGSLAAKAPVTETQLSAEQYFARGRERHKVGDLDGAIADYDRLIKLKPDAATAYMYRGEAHHKKGDTDRAIDDFNRAILLDSQDAIAYNGRALARADKGDYRGAFADMSQFLQLAPGHIDAPHARKLLEEWRHKR